MSSLKKDGKINFNKSGSGSFSGRITIPVEFLQLMNIDKDNREVEISYAFGRLIITKK